MNQQQIPAPENPRLRAALREIEETMQRHDVAGICILQVPTHCQFYVKVDPSHSLAYLNGKNFEVREPIIPGPDDVEGTKAYKQKIANTLNMCVNLQIMCSNVLQALVESTMKVRQTFNLFPPAQANGKQKRHK
jgi:hypothetical protein